MWLEVVDWWPAIACCVALGAWFVVVPVAGGMAHLGVLGAGVAHGAVGTGVVSIGLILAWAIMATAFETHEHVVARWLQRWPPPSVRRARRQAATHAVREAKHAQLDALREQLWREQLKHRHGGQDDPFVQEALDEIDALLRQPKPPEGRDDQRSP